MMLEGTNASAAIRWVRQDLDERLQSVRDNLEAFASNTDDREPLKAVQEHLELLNLTFMTMAQQGASILTDEMIAVGGHMLHSGGSAVNDSLAALTDAVIVLPSYLDRLQAGHDDLPILLLPTLNELRATYDEALLSEGTLFAPQLDVMIPELSGSESGSVGANEFETFARRTRNQYQAALVGWLKEQSKIELLKPLQSVCNTLQLRLSRYALRRLWWIAEMTIAGFHEGALDNDLPLRRLFARLDLMLKTMSEGGQTGPSEEAITALSRALLFQAAQARPGSKHVDLLRQRFKLEELIPDREALLRARGAVTGRDAELFKSIGTAIREEMGLVKDTLDMELRTGQVEKEQRDSSLASLQQLADTLHMLNLPVPARAVEELLPGLEQTEGVENNELDSPLLKLARKLIEVESLLDAHIRLLGEPIEVSERRGHIELPAHEQRLILSCVLDQCVINLQEIQDCIRKQLAGDAAAGFDDLLASISGALLLAGQSEVAALTDKLGRALHAGLHAKATGASDAEAHLEPLADAVAALELYLAGCRDEQANSLHFLEIMHQRLEGLPESTATGQQIEQTHIVLPARADAPIKGVAAVAKVAEPPADVLPAGATIDADLLAVFLEEFDSVSKQLTQTLPLWLEDPANAKRMAEIKRGFHTLKGSGRMVGATEIGDFAWRVEEVLNRVTEGRLTADETVTGLVRLASAALPDLKNRLLQQPGELKVQDLAGINAFGQKLTRGESPLLETLLRTLPDSFVARALQRERTEPTGLEDTGTLVAAVEVPEFTAPEITKAAIQAEIVVAPEPEAAAVAGAVPTTVPESAAPVRDNELARLMAVEMGQCIARIENFVSGSPPVADFEMIRSVHTLAGTLSLSPLGQESELARALEHYFEALHKQDQVLNRDGKQTIELCQHRFRQRLYVLEKGESTTYPLMDAALLSQLAALTDAVKAPPVVLDVPTATTEADTALAEVHADSLPEPDPHASVAPASGQLTIEEGGVLSIFLEEATEVLERCDTLLNTWRDKLSDMKLVQNLQREVHTFKGGARMAGLNALGDLSHAMETLLEQIAANRLQATVASVQALEEGCDRLTLWVEQILSGHMPEAGEALARFESRVKALSVLPAGKPVRQTTPVLEVPEDIVSPVLDKTPTRTRATEPKPVPAPVAALDSGIDSVTVPAADSKPTASPATVSAPAEESFRIAADASLARSRPTPANTGVASQRSPAEAPKRIFRDVQDQPVAEAGDDTGSQAQIRVAAELMDSLVNYAGEISIYRARLEQQLSTVRFNLKDVGQTIGRLKEQLRQMELETDAQMLSRYQSASSKGSSEFDPLELDRFSNMQQLSRALSESVSDLVNLQDMLGSSVREAEALLVQQSRVSTDLQEGLMQTRMTPFGSAAPRLRRVVRAAAAETGKQVRLQLKMAGSSDQLDRNVLERITAPLEHMLRNSVVHGIELPKVRRKRDKAEEGEITVTVEAEATEFVVRVEDDGNGVNLESVRKRAIERGMIRKDEEVSEQRLTSFILESGFSTAESVTGLAGRGVGMDVVNSEVKQIGGSMEISTVAGQGACFTIRIPFSLAVMQAIGITVGNRPFLVPLNSVSGVARMLPADYSALRASASPVYEFAGESYPVLELEPLLGGESTGPDSGNVSLLMIRAGEAKAAFRVAELQGHQEVVIKPVGPQISSIPGILGATISADGQVVIILDMGPVIRRGLAAAAQPAPVVAPARKPEKRTPLVMVVDDSITMRKVTSRVLENHSLEVMTAQDGLDAIENLHERIPDLMLLDIEMPRMDGYELAEHVRADPRLRHIPIVMITSRAGQKHRKKARDAGANAYLTKPYQEADLVAQVAEMLKMDLQQRRSE